MMNRMLLQKVGGGSPSEDLPFFDDAIFYVNRFYNNDITTDANGIVLEWVNRADNNNNLSRVGVADADLPIDNAVDKTVRFQNNKKLILQQDILFNATASTFFFVGKSSTISGQGEISLNKNPSTNGVETRLNFPDAGKEAWLYPANTLQFTRIGSAFTEDFLYEKHILGITINYQNSQSLYTVYSPSIQESGTIPRNLASSIIGFLNELAGNRYGTELFYEARSILTYNAVRSIIELETVRDYYLTQFSITPNP